MRKSSGWMPSIVPNEDDQDVYLVLDDLGRLGRVWREGNAEGTDLETILMELLEGQYQNPVRVISFNTAEKWSQDVSGDVAQEVRRRCDLQLRDVPFGLEEYVTNADDRGGLSLDSFDWTSVTPDWTRVLQSIDRLSFSTVLAPGLVPDL